MEISIRSATRADLPAVVELARRWVAEDITYGQRAEPLEWFIERLGSYFFVATARAEVAGYAQGERLVSGDAVSAVLDVGTPFVEITNIYVDPAHRGLGIGSQLLQAVLGAAADDGVMRSLLFTGTKDVAAVLRFYGRHGYQGWGVQMVK